jgi:hypothetical protein
MWTLFATLPTSFQQLFWKMLHLSGIILIQSKYFVFLVAHVLGQSKHTFAFHGLYPAILT